MTVVEYIKAQSLKYDNYNSAKNLRTLASHVKKFGCTLTLNQIDRKFLIDFMNYLNKNANKSASAYFTKLKQVLYQAISDELIKDLPYLRKMSIKHNNAVREYLTVEELMTLNKYDYHKVDYKNAFIFSCNTGLRFIDLLKLSFDNVSNEILDIIQEKTKDHLTMKLHPVANRIIEMQRKEKSKSSDLVINIASYEIWRRNVIDMCSLAGIKKELQDIAQDILLQQCAYPMIFQ